eukprot:206493-Alexandrium_andersonii.AAC.1
MCIRDRCAARLPQASWAARTAAPERADELGAERSRRGNAALHGAGGLLGSAQDPAEHALAK